MRDFQSVFAEVSCDSQPEFSERRRSNREECELRGSILIGGSIVGHCVIRDFSCEGARLVVPNGSWVPREFEIAGLSKKITVRVNRIWTSKGELGVQFLNPINLTST